MQKTVGYFQTFEHSKEISCRLIHSKNLSFMPHMHTQTEIIYLLKGSLMLSIGEQEYNLISGNIAVIRPYKVHAFANPVNCDCLIMIFEKQLIPEWTNTIKHKEIENPVLGSGEYPYILHSIMSPLVNLDKSQYTHDSYQLMLKGMLTTLIGLLLDKWLFSPIPISKAKHLSYVQRVIEYVDDHYNQTACTLSEMSKTLGLSYTIVQRIFTEHLGCHFSEYINNLRVQHAKALMSTDMEIIDIAFEAGFASLRSFYRVFGQTYDMPPKKYRDLITLPKKQITPSLNYENECI